MPIREYADPEISAGMPYADWLRTNGPDPKGVDDPSAAYLRMIPKWERIQTVLDGTDAMRQVGVKYLPRHRYEDGQTYKERLETANLDNWSLRTLETLVGKAFKEPPVFKDMPAELVAIKDDMDGAGNSMLGVAERWFREGVAKAAGHLLVDFTKPQPRADGLARTLEDDRRDGVRPFWRTVCPEDVIDMKGVTVRGEFTLTSVRIVENSMEPDGAWGEVLVERIRVLQYTPGAAFSTWALYRKIKDKRTKKDKWVLDDAGVMDVDRIPLVSFYTEYQGLNEGKPPIEDLVHLNVTHFQSSSDQRSILTVSRFAMLAASGCPAQDPEAGDSPIVVGPNKWLSLDDPQGRFYYVEHTGAAINAGRQDLQDLEQRMSSYGAEFLKKQPGRASATSRALDSTQSTSMLVSWVRAFGEALQQAISLTEEWMGIAEAGTVVIHKLADDLELGDATELGELRATRQFGDMSRVAYLTELKRRHVLPDDYDIDADQAQIDSEPLPGSIMGLGFGAASVMDGGGGPPKRPDSPVSSPARGSETKPTPSQGDKGNT